MTPTKGMSAGAMAQILRYDADTGALFWLRDRSRRVRKGDRAGWMCNGYNVVRIKGKNYRAHRIAWLLSHGKWPKNQIDHINGDRSDNRLINLREATHSQNTCNIGPRSSNKCGEKGVCWHVKSKRWRAAIQVDHKLKFLGAFKSKSDAVSAYKKAAEELHGEFAHHLCAPLKNKETK